MLIAVPANLVANWVAEFRRWLGVALTVFAVDNSSGMRAKDQLAGFAATRAPAHSIAIVSYEMLQRHGECLQAMERPIELLVADEAHRLRDAGGARSRALAAVPTKRRILLSATPLPNSLGEL